MYKKYFFFLSALALLNLLFLPLPLKALKNEIIAKIDNNIITAYEVKNKIKTSLILSNQDINQKNIDNNKKRALIYLIDLKLKKNELRKYKMDVDNINVNDQLLSISSNNINEFKERFQQLGINFELFVNEIKIETGWKQLMFNIYKDKVKIDQKEIDREVLNFIKSSSNIIELNISEIEINFDNNSNYQDEINFINKEISENGFEKTAQKFSIASTSKNFGKIGWINSESLNSKVSKVLNDLQIGEVSTPIKSLNSLIFFKLIDKRVSKIDDLNTKEFKKRLIDQKKNELFNLYSRSHLSKLKNNSLIEYK